MGKATEDKISVPFPDEPGSIFMTQSEWDRFKAQLGTDCAMYWCERAEAYAEEWPRRWAKYKNHFRTLTNWHSMKLSDGYQWFDHPETGPGYYKIWVIDYVRRDGRRA